MSYARIEEGWRIRCREKRCCYLYKACCSSGAAGLYKQFVGRWGGVGSVETALAAGRRQNGIMVLE